MIQIEVTNNKVYLTGDRKVLNRLYEDMKVRHPNQWYLKPHMPRGWDGKIEFLSKSGYSNTGLLPMIMEKLQGVEVTVKDNRVDQLNFIGIPSKVGKMIPRDYQIEAVESLVKNKIQEIRFDRGIIAAATNAGKTVIAGMIYKSYENAKALILMNNKDLYQQFQDDMPDMFGDNWGYMQGNNIKWADIMICMTPTLVSRMEQYKSKLAKYNMILFDECHQVTSKTNKKALSLVYNSVVRVGLSGTPLSHKDKIKNMQVLSLFGNIVYKISNTSLIDRGFSSPIVVKINKGNESVRIEGDYKEEYDQGIIYNPEREQATINRVSFYMRRGISPILVVAKYHAHVERLYEILKREFFLYKVSYVHDEVKNRKSVIDNFKRGNTDILVASLIIKLGQNMPLIKVLINASSGDSAINTLQLLGRALRVHHSKTKTYVEDFYDKGKYLQRHSKHRIKYYKDEKLKVIELYKK